MASAIYPNFFRYVMSGNTVDLHQASDIKVALWDADTDPYDKDNTFYSDLVPAASVANSTLSNTLMGDGTTYANGVFTADSVTFTSVSGANCEALILYKDTGVSTTSPLIAYIDSGDVTGLPVTPNGSNIVINWNASGILKF